MTIDPLDAQLLERIQVGIPLVREPFATLAEQLGVSERVVLDRLEALCSPGGVIREMAGIFDVVKLGYRQSLVALRLAPDRLDAGGGLVAEHPGISHCYGRDGEYNLWFTLAVSPKTALGLEASVELLARLAGADGSLVLPTLRRYKLQVRFSATGVPISTVGPGSGVDEMRPAAPVDLTDDQVRALRALQIGLPIRSDPFAELGRQVELDADDLLVCAADFLAAGLLRRYSAVLFHRKAGAAANVMVVWRVAEGQGDAAGAAAAAERAVSHCYLRPTYPDWPWGLYTMVHGTSREDCLAAIDRLAAATGLTDHRALWTTKEYKKRRVRLFDPAEAAWEGEYGE